MQKLIYSPLLGLSILWRQLLTTSKVGLLASCALFLLSGLANPVQASGFYKDYIILNGKYFYTNNSVGGTPPFQSQPLGTFDRGYGSLTLGAEANTFSENNDDVQPPQLFYKVYPEHGTDPRTIPFTPLNLGFVQAGIDGFNNKKWNNITTLPNLISATNAADDYVLEVYFQSRENYNRGNPLYDSNGGANYKAYFKVTGSVPVQWNGSADDNWFNAENWYPKSVPTYNTDATIPFSSRGPVINKPSDGSAAQVRTLNVLGDQYTPGAVSLIQKGGELQIFGDFVNTRGSFRQDDGLLTLAGQTQTFDGGSFFNMNIQGGGRKTLRGRMDILTNLNFTNGIIVTRTDNTTDYNVDLGATATITGESESNYVLGVLRSKDHIVNQGQTNTFGNIGAELTTTTGSPGKTLVTRITGPDDFTYNGVGTSRSIRRGFIFQPDNQGTFSFTLAFHYLDDELNTIPENNLVLFRSLNGTTPFEKLNKTSTADNVLIRTAIDGTLAATFTLGDAANPLPVTLVSFTAAPTAQGGALLRWATATETNNKGFGIERQLASGGTWQSVGYLATGNSANGGTYEYTDKSLATATFTPQAYYRLRQEDLDGKLSYSPVAVVSRSAVAVSTSLLLSPVPVTGSSLSLTFAEAGQAGLEISITNVQGQRLLHYTTKTSDAAALSLPVEHLAAGVYIVSVRVPGQALRHARFVKL
ncbi:MAG: T9SS type A sorting domain-containing protein [Hymenobacter sp.]|nr:MAG: T9SS type A sorting domain-containing protein [Hymenobacter sp.]